MENLVIHTPYIRLDQAMKLASFVASGAEAKALVQEGAVAVNGTVCTQRGKKLYDGDCFSFGDAAACISSKGEA